MPARPTVLTIGEILVEFISHQTDCGLQIIGDYSGPYPSGAPAIFLDQAARMGAPAQLFGGVGDDGFGRIVLARLEADGVGTAGVARVPGKSTGVAFVSYYANGERDFIFHITNTAADHFRVDTSSLDLASAYVHISGASLGNTAMRDAILELVRAVHSAGGKVFCDPNARPTLMQDEDVADALAEVMALSYCLMPSTSDLAFLYPGCSEALALETLQALPAEIVVLKRGAAGATVVVGGEQLDFAGHPVNEIDPTGAGDCFCGTFVAMLAQGESLEDAGRLANAAGAIAVTRRGPMEGNSNPDEIEAFLNPGQSRGAIA